MSPSRGSNDCLTPSAALASAQAAYANTQLARPSEFDDLFAAAGRNYENSSSSASAAFAIGGNVTISFGCNYAGGALREALGHTASNSSSFCSDPEGIIPQDNEDLTLDFVRLFGASASAWHTSPFAE